MESGSSALPTAAIDGDVESVSSVTPTVFEVSDAETTVPGSPPVEPAIEAENFFDDSGSPMYTNGSYMPDPPPSPVLPLLDVGVAVSGCSRASSSASAARSRSPPRLRHLSFGGVEAFGRLDVSLPGSHEYPGLSGGIWSWAAAIHSAVAQAPPGRGRALAGLRWYVQVRDGDRYAHCCAHIDMTRGVFGGMFYIGITEDPRRRWTEHQEANAAWAEMHVLVMAESSRETSALETRLISQYAGNLWCNNIGPGGERRSAGSPHYLYVLVANTGLLRR